MKALTVVVRLTELGMEFRQAETEQELVQQIVHPLSYAIKITLKLTPRYHHSTVLPSSEEVSLIKTGKWICPRYPQPQCVMSLVLMTFLLAEQK